jgi:hypothetical protein
MQKQVKTISAGLMYMQAAVAAMPKTLGDRELVVAMHDALALAVRNRFAFNRDEAPTLDRQRIEGSGAVFRPLDVSYYLLACRYGGTFARMWEAHHDYKPWVADIAIFQKHHGGFREERTIENNRVAEGAGALLPGTDDPDLATINGLQAWWVTSQTKDTITLCRYRVSLDCIRYHGADAPFVPQGRPARVRKLTREQWVEWNRMAAVQRTPLAA